MKKYFYLTLNCSLILNSCSEEKVNQDAADAFVGEYSVSVIEYVTWGASSGTLNNNATIVITKISANSVQISGYINTRGEISGNSIYMEGGRDSDGAGFLTTSYGVGELCDKILTFTAYQTGQLASNGILYPYRNTSYFTAIKQN